MPSHHFERFVSLSGDFDGNGSCSECSYDSKYAEYNGRPCSIANSSTNIRRSKWKTLKHYLRCYVRRRRTETKRTKRELENKKITKDSDKPDSQLGIVKPS